MINLENHFYGRKTILELLKKRVLDLKEGYRQNIAFIGSSYIGKSTVIKKFISDYEDQNLIIIYLDFEHKNFPHLAYSFIGSLLYHFVKSQRLPLNEDINLLLECSQPYIPQTVLAIKKIRDLVAEKKFPEVYQALLTLPEILITETNKFCLLIFDEFQDLENFDIPHVFLDLGKKIMTQRRCLYFMVSSYPRSSHKILSEKLSLLFGNFEEIIIGPFDLKTSQEFIEYHLQEIPIGVQLRNFLTDFSGGHPLYLKLFCQEIIYLSSIYKQQEVYMPILIQAIENTIFNEWGVLNQHFHQMLQKLSQGKGNELVSSCLVELALGRNKLRELAGHLGQKQNIICQRINHLIDEDLIIKNGSYYQFKDRLFKYWIRFVYHKRLRSLEFDPEKQRKDFKEEITKSVENFKLTSRKDLPSRIAELFYCFENESLFLNGRRYKLPVFQEIIPIKLRHGTGNYFDVIKATSKEGLWFIVLKQDPIFENDVYTLMSEAKKLDQRPQRCVLIALSDLDENARLKALQEKFWIWHEEEINSLLNLYDKFYIVR